jgi:hypothetical protein
MMTYNDLDARLAALLAEPMPAPDPGFTSRIVALAAHDLAVRRARRRAFQRIAGEAFALAAVITAFALLARSAPDAAGFGEAVALANPALLGLAMLSLWGLVGLRPAASWR